MARRRSRYGGIVSVGLGALPLVDENVKVLDVGVGVVAGLAGAALLKGLLKKFAPDIYMKLAGAVGAGMPLVAGVGAAATLFYAQQKMNRGRATGHAAGAALAGLTLAAWSFAQSKAASLPSWLDLSGTEMVNLGGAYGGAYGGMLVNDGQTTIPSYGGLLVADNSNALNQLGAMSMGDDDYETGDGGLAALSNF